MSGRDRNNATVHHVDPFDENQPSQLGEEHLQALRSSVHRPPSSNRRRILPLFVVLVAAIGMFVFTQWDALFADQTPTTSTAPPSLAEQVETALVSQGFDDVTVQVDGDMVTISGYVASAALLEEAETVAFSVGGVATVDNRLQVGTPGDDELVARAEAALSDDAYRAVVISVRDGVLVLGGVVASDEARSAAASLVRNAAGAAKVANRLVVGELPEVPVTTPEETVPDEELATRVDESLRSTGFDNLTAAASNGMVTVEGVVPLGVLEQGFFGYSHRVEAVVLATSGVNGVTTRLRLRGDEEVLRSKLHDLVKTSPIVFDSGSAELAPENRQTLDTAAEIILSQPGLQVFIAGYTDQVGSSTSNEQLAAARAGAVYQYLILKGVPPSRLAVVSYGELFAGAGAPEQSRRIEFEVGP